MIEDQAQTELDRRNGMSGVYIGVGRRRVEVTLKSILGITAILGTFWACATYIGGKFVWPWSDQAVDIKRLENKARIMDSVYSEAIEHYGGVIDSVRVQHQRTREEISELRIDMNLTAQATCAMARRFAPESAPEGCAAVLRRGRN